MLELCGLTKAYGDLLAVNDLSFSLEPGDIFGFIGSNGAGKTTTIRMLATLLDPTAGTASLDGADIRRNPMAIRRMIGYMPDFFGLYDDIKVWEYLDFFANLYRVPIRERPALIDKVLELTYLNVKKDTFVQALSRGMQQRLCLARCLVHDPALLLLDEPASGLDPRARAELRELLLLLGEMGKIIIVSSHILPELSGFCNKVGIIERGNLVAFGPVEEVTGALALGRSFVLTVLSPISDAEKVLRAEGTVGSVEPLDDSRLRVEFAGTIAEQAGLLEKLIESKVKVATFQELELNLEDVFLKLTKGAVN